MYVGKRRVDFFVEAEIMGEVKALILYEDVHLAQTIDYLEAYNLEVGLLLNFAASATIGSSVRASEPVARTAFAKTLASESASRFISAFGA